MRRKDNLSGFTILEVALVLAITFLIFIAMIGTIQVSISLQRYNDSVVSFQDFIQRQYSEVQNVVVDTGTSRIPGCGDKRGRSNCYIIGRLLNFNLDGGYTNVKVEQIVYIADDSTDTAKGLAYNDFFLTDSVNTIFNTKGITVDNYSFEWSAKAFRPDNGRVFNDDLSIFIFRSPETGTIRTHVKTDTKVESNNVKSILTTDSVKKNLDICVIADGPVFTPNKAVRINAGASNASAIEIPVPGKNASAGEVNCAR